MRRLGKADAARILSRALARNRGDSAVTVVDVLLAAQDLDLERGVGDHLEACAYFCDWCDDAFDADVAFVQHSSH